MPEADEELVCRFQVSRSPEDLKAWWIDLPEAYTAEDSREQPHRIELVKETQDGGIYDTTWRGPLGIPFTLREILHDEGPGRWRFEVPGPGFRIEDRYTAEPTQEEDGAIFEIRSTLTYDAWYGKLLRRLLMPRWRAKFQETFSNAVDVFEDEHEPP